MSAQPEERARPPTPSVSSTCRQQDERGSARGSFRESGTHPHTRSLCGEHVYVPLATDGASSEMAADGELAPTSSRALACRAGRARRVQSGAPVPDCPLVSVALAPRRAARPHGARAARDPALSWTARGCRVLWRTCAAAVRAHGCCGCLRPRKRADGSRHLVTSACFFPRAQLMDPRYRRGTGVAALATSLDACCGLASDAAAVGSAPPPPLPCRRRRDERDRRRARPPLRARAAACRCRCRPRPRRTRRARDAAAHAALRYRAASPVSSGSASPSSSPARAPRSTASVSTRAQRQQVLAVAEPVAHPQLRGYHRERRCDCGAGRGGRGRALPPARRLRAWRCRTARHCRRGRPLERRRSRAPARCAAVQTLGWRRNLAVRSAEGRPAVPSSVSTSVSVAGSACTCATAELSPCASSKCSVSVASVSNAISVTGSASAGAAAELSPCASSRCGVSASSGVHLHQRHGQREHLRDCDALAVRVLEVQRVSGVRVHHYSRHGQRVHLRDRGTLAVRILERQRVE